VAAVAVDAEEFKALNVVVLTISVDSPFTHKAWDEHELREIAPGGAPWPMLSDQTGKIGQAYGVYDDDTGTELRSYFLIDPQGTIQAMSVMVSSVGHDILEVVRQIKAIQHAMDTGESTPAGWQPGAPTLKPGPDLVGKVHDVWQPTSIRGNS
jgi:peroxiredoxin (alkyl hydroperoxide reductase subunit C)